jgi:hypothetical protein
VQIGAPKELRNKLDDITKKFQRFQDGKTTRIGDDPSLDFFMVTFLPSGDVRVFVYTHFPLRSDVFRFGTEVVRGLAGEVGGGPGGSVQQVHAV